MKCPHCGEKIEGIPESPLEKIRSELVGVLNIIDRILGRKG